MNPTVVWCPACRGAVSSAAFACPHCGQPLRTAYVQTTRGSAFLDPNANLRSCLGCLGLLFVLAVGALVWLFAASH